MPFGVVSGVGRGMGVLDEGGDHRRGRGSFVGEFGASHCNRWGFCSVIVRERRALLELLWGGLVLFGVERTVQGGRRDGVRLPAVSSHAQTYTSQ